MTGAGPDTTDQQALGRTGRGKRMVLLALAVTVVAAATGGGWWWWMAQSRVRAERVAAEALADRFVRAYEQRDLSGLPSAAPGMAEQFAGAVDGLDEASVSVTVTPVVIDETGATSELGVVWELPGGHRPTTDAGVRARVPRHGG